MTNGGVPGVGDERQRGAGNAGDSGMPCPANGPGDDDTKFKEAYKKWLADRPAGPIVTTLIALYLLATGVGAAWVLWSIFPEATIKDASIVWIGDQPGAGADGGAEPAGTEREPNGTAERSRVVPREVLEFHSLRVGSRALLNGEKLSTDRGLILLALMAGVLGSFMHAAQSLAVFVGNRQFKASWLLWYLLRPASGSVLGLLFYFVIRAGLLSASADAVSPYGVVAFAALGGWFAKQATDKLAEVFDTLFRTNKPAEYKDKLSDRQGAARITAVEPLPVPTPAAVPGELKLTVKGECFAKGSRVRLDRLELRAENRSATELWAWIPEPSRAGLVGKEKDLTVVNPSPAGTPSEPFRVKFEA